MHLSHSGLQQILKCPASYFWYKVQGVSPKKESAALEIGSAFHWGCEHNTDDLSDYLDELDPYQKSYYNFNVDVAMAEGMLKAYFAKKDYLFDQILTDYDGVERLHIIEEYHELDLTVPLKSKIFPKDHEFHGIIDLLLLTEKGWIILDYKTSSKRPDFDKYLDQVLRYAWMIKTMFPEVPVYKIGIINVRKTAIRMKTNESVENFAMRVKREYNINDDELITYHQFAPSDFEDGKMNLYIDNLSRMCDFAQTIQDNGLWFINYGNAVSEYGKSEYWDLFYKTKDYVSLYKICDPMFDETMGEFTKYRDCIPLDMESINKKVLNHYRQFEESVLKYIESGLVDQNEITKKLKEEFYTDDDLLERYWKEFFRVQQDAETASG